MLRGMRDVGAGHAHLGPTQTPLQWWLILCQLDSTKGFSDKMLLWGASERASVDETALGVMD